jgi:S-adenosylmethionine:tRNA-ribosyltransferase-isomerase (queuine synthetase)
LEKILEGKKLTLKKLSEKLSFGLITGDVCKTKEQGSMDFSNILDEFQQGNIDILMFSKVIREGIDLKSAAIMKGDFKWCVASDSMYAYYRRNKKHFWKKTIAFSKENKDSCKIGSVNVSSYTNPVKHFIHMGMKWDMKNIQQATGRCLRGDSHPIHYNSNGEIDNTFPRGILYIHNILVWNPFYMPGTTSKNDESDLLTVDQRKEEIIHEKLKRSEKIMNSLSARCVDCTLKASIS